MDGVLPDSYLVASTAGGRRLWPVTASEATPVHASAAFLRGCNGPDIFRGPPRPGWICSKCQASINPDVQQCPSCMPPVTSLSGATVNVDELLNNKTK